MRLVRSHDPAIISYRSLGLLVVDPRAELSTTYGGSDQSAVIICGVKKVIGCLIAQSYERERERERERKRERETGIGAASSYDRRIVFEKKSLISRYADF